MPWRLGDFIHSMNGPVTTWFREAIGAPFDFQQRCWSSQLTGRSGLLHTPTGMGKTFAAYLPTLMRLYDSTHHLKQPPPLTMLWITPLRALATDTEQTLRQPIEALRLPWTLQRRTGDVPSSVKAKQKDRLPTVLVTTPESLSVLLSYADAQERFSTLTTVIVDEWHELMSDKRGTQAELALARLRRWNPALITWGLSATLGNLDEAMQTLLGADASRGELIHGRYHKDFTLETLIPRELERFPWAGHLGLRMLPGVIDAIESAGATLLFTNTRSQAEIWFREINAARPDWLGRVALHHGSIDRKTRFLVEDMIRSGQLRCCVCTSSLDLGVDFSPVDQVIQVASPKGVARLLQRAGRSGHRPGATSKVVGVPTNALELIDFAAARDTASLRKVESRRPLDRPLDVLVQHLVTCAMGGGFDENDLYEEVCTAHSYRQLTRQEWQWAMDFVIRGGSTLTAYPQYARIAEQPAGSGRYTIASLKIARSHRMSIGTITSDASIVVRFANGKKLGTVEESFVGFLRPKENFVFAGHLLELVQVRQMTAIVRKVRGSKGTVPRWQGGKSPLSTQLAAAVRVKLSEAREGRYDSPEMQAARPLLELQRLWSMIPTEGELLIEAVQTRDGHHRFLYPLQGRSVHEGLGALLAHRLTQREPRTVIVTANDYGLELLSPEPWSLNQEDWHELFATQRLLDDLLACVDTGQLARRQFRDIARIAGLINAGFPGQSQSNHQLQASSELFFDVFREFDPENLLLDQAKREVLDRQLEVNRLRLTLESLRATPMLLKDTHRLTPLAFPLWAERLREQHLTSQSFEERITRMLHRLEAEAGVLHA